MEQFDIGQQTLQTIAQAEEFNKWMYATIAPFLKGHVLEIGSGIGNISKHLIKDGYPITLTDINKDYLQYLSAEFGNCENVKAITRLDLTDANFSTIYKPLQEKFDSIFFLNVLEHIENDSLAISNCNYLLKPGGTIIILVPAYNFLYSKMDKELGHFRRYTAKSLERVVTQNGCTVQKIFYFNSLGIAGWAWNKLFKKTEISHNKMSAFNVLVPFAKFLDKVFLHHIGLSVIVVARKKQTI